MKRKFLYSGDHNLAYIWYSWVGCNYSNGEIAKENYAGSCAENYRGLKGLILH